MPDPRAQIDRLRERIQASDEISDADADALIEFSDALFLVPSECGDYRHAKLLRHCVLIAESVGGLAAALDDREAAEEIVRWINRVYDNEETNRDYRVAFRMFGRRVTDANGDDPPESIDWVPSGTSSNYDPKPDPATMLGWDEHAKPMIEATRNARDAAMIALAWDAGPRGGEFHDLRVGDVSDHDLGLRISVDGKNGQRSVTLIKAVPYVQRWLDDHPASDDPTAPLWSKLTTSDPLSKALVTKQIRIAAIRALTDAELDTTDESSHYDYDLPLPVTLTNFRKSSASWHASQGMSQAHLEKRYGWVRGSDAAARYVAVFGEASDKELASIHNIDYGDADDDQPTGPVECPRCGRDTPRDEDFCMWCKQAIDPTAIEEFERDKDELRRDFLAWARDNPDALEDAQRREELLNQLGADPDILEQALAFVDAADDSDDH